MAEENEQLLSCVLSARLVRIFPQLHSSYLLLAPDAAQMEGGERKKKKRPILILSASRSVLPLYLSVCGAQGRALALSSQRIRHAEC